ncbi:hypothetical protein [Micromonospora fulviviridis]|uniref:hypothetical protein n=1 Tax=Micromonospora fulviviridis TaxID=47860 RepID=UPI00378AAFA6
MGRSSALTGATDVLDPHTSCGTNLSLRERLDHIAHTLATVLARHDKATTARHRAGEFLIHAGTDLVSDFQFQHR